MAITLKTWGTQLADCQAAIEATQVSQQYSINGREQRRARLEELHAREKFLIGKLETDGDVVVGSSVQRGSAQVSFS